MRNTATFTLLALLALTLAAIPLTGCTQTDEVAPGQTQDESPAICPDTLLQGDTVVFSTSMDNNGQPLGIETTFSTDTAEIFSTFTLSGGLCCSDVIMIWQQGDETVFYWSRDGTGMPATNTVSMTKPEGGFARGEYLVKVYVGIRELISETFVVE